MPELLQKERLQPSLLDRLTDNSPEKKIESRSERVLTLAKLREIVLRDLRSLLNTGSLSGTVNLDDYPLTASSVINYGMPDLSGVTVSTLDIQKVEKCIKQAISDFEPRIIKKSIKVNAFVEKGTTTNNIINFEIKGDLWAQPVPLRLLMKTEVDLECGSFIIKDCSSERTE